LYVSDDSGYQVGPHDLELVGVTLTQLVLMMHHRVPLGMNATTFNGFRRGLAEAARRDAIDDLDVRLQGSSSKFFSGAHKSMVYAREDIVGTFLQQRERLPETYELDQIEQMIKDIWPDETRRPVRRFFDAYHALGISAEHSDYDVQISSATLARRARDSLSDLGLSSEFDMRDPHYRYIHKGIAFKIAPNLHMWSALQEDILRRRVTIVVFPAEGPDELTDEPLLSSHHRPTDWVIMGGGA